MARKRRTRAQVAKLRELLLRSDEYWAGRRQRHATEMQALTSVRKKGK